MKYIKYIILITCVISSIHLYVQQEVKNLSDQESFKNIIAFFTTSDDDNPSGQYWPALQTQGTDGHIINNASAYIADDSYGDVIESKELLINKNHYLGYFIDEKSQDTIYLYGTKDEIDSDNDDDGIVIGDDDEN